MSNTVSVVKDNGMTLTVKGGPYLGTATLSTHPHGFEYGGRIYVFESVRWDSSDPEVRTATAVDAEYRRRHEDIDRRRQGAPAGTPLGRNLPHSCRLTPAEQRRWDDYYGECGFHWGTHYHLPVPTAEQVEAWRRRSSEADHLAYVRRDRIRSECRRAANAAASSAEWYRRTCFNSSLTEADVQEAANKAWAETEARLEKELPQPSMPVHPALA